MAGDIGIPESVAPTGPAAMAGAPVPMLHDYGPNFRIRIGKALAGGPVGAPLNEAALSPTERFGHAALNLRESPEYLMRKAERPYQARQWARGPSPLHRDEQAIVPHSPDHTTTGGGGGSAGGGSAAGGIVGAAPLAKRLAGRIAVGTIMVSGPEELALTNAQQVKIAAEVQNGLSWLGGQSPARDVTWVHDSHHVTVSVAPPTGPVGGNPWEHFEGPWRDAALTQLGFATGAAGVNAYISALKTSKGADAAYCAFFTHYPLNHFGYCTGPYLVMQFENDGWGPDNLDRVFAHESGHVFGAPDEYSESGCNCGGSHGFFGKPNLNCENCAQGGGVECLMRANTWAMCSVTPYHLGYNGLPAEAPTVPTAFVA